MQARYELMVILKADRREEEISKHLGEIKKLVSDLDGKFFHEDDWGKRDLAYKIKKEEIGYYTVFGFELDPGKINEVNDALRIDPAIIRYLLSRMPKGYELTEITQADLDFSKPSNEEKKEEEEKPKPAAKPEVKKVEEKGEAPAEPKKEEVEEQEEVEVVEEIEEQKTEEPAEEIAQEEEVVQEEEKKEEPKEEPEKEEKKKEITMDDLDEKLKAIMNDTDIDISL